MRKIVKEFRLNNGYSVTIWSDGKCILDRWDKDILILSQSDITKLIEIYQATCNSYIDKK